MSDKAFVVLGVILLLALCALLVFGAVSCHDCDHHNKIYINPVAPLPELVMDCELVDNNLIEISVHNSVTAILRVNDNDTTLAMTPGNYNIYYAVCDIGTFTFTLDSLPSGDHTPVQCEVRLSSISDNLGCYVEETEKVELCHQGHTIRVSLHALQAHLNHGDLEGPCTFPVPDEPNPPIPCVKGFVAEIVE